MDATEVEQVIDRLAAQGVALGVLSDGEELPQGQMTEATSFLTVGLGGDSRWFVVDVSPTLRAGRNFGVQNDLELLLFARGAPIAEPIGNSRKIDNGRSVIIRAFVEGKQFRITEISEERLQVLGRSLAVFHMSTMDISGSEYHKPRRKRDPLRRLVNYGTATANLVRCFRRSNGPAPIAEAVRAAALFVRRRCRVSASPPLPSGILHGDLYAGNIIFTGADAMEPCLLNLDAFYHGELIDDLADALAKTCNIRDWDGPVFSPEKASALLRGYNVVRPLSDAEVRVLPDRIYERAFRIKAIRGSSNLARHHIPDVYRRDDYPNQIVREVVAIADACAKPDWLWGALRPG